MYESDIKTINQVQQEEPSKVEPSPDSKTMFPYPKTGCKHCYGYGFRGFIRQQGKDKVNICRCITNAMFKKDVQTMTYHEFKTMMSYAVKIYNLKEPHEELSVQDVQTSSQEDGHRPDEVQSAISGQSYQ